MSSLTLLAKNILFCTSALAVCLPVFAASEPARCRSNQSMQFDRLKSDRDAFSEAFQCPAQDIQLTSEKINADWTQAGSLYGTNPGSWPADMQALLELSLEASRVWEALVQCEGSPENARLAYANRSIRCKNVKKDLDNLKKITFQYGATTSIAEHEEKGLKINEFPEMHPLIVEFFLEHLAGAKAYYSIDQGRSTTVWQRLPNLFNLFGNVVHEVGYTGRIDSSPLYSNRVTNNLKVLSFLHNSSCSEWGVFPRAARSLIFGLDMSRTVYQIGQPSSNSGFVRVLFDVSNKVDICGNINMDLDAFHSKWREIVKHYKFLDR